MTRRFAVFDIDGTVVRTALFLQIVDELIANGVLDKSYRARLDEKLYAYRTRAHREAFHEYNETSVEVLFNNLAGLSVNEYRAATDRVLARSREQTYVYTRELIRDLKAQDYFLIALSGSEQYAVEEFTKQYGFDFVAGDKYLARDGVFTGEIETIFHDKGAALKQIVADNDLSYENSLAIGDSVGDGKMLALVKQPIAFNPEAKLFELAKQQGWPIIIERKNVIYRLEPQDGRYLLA